MEKVGAAVLVGKYSALGSLNGGGPGSVGQNMINALLEVCGAPPDVYHDPDATIIRRPRDVL